MPTAAPTAMRSMSGTPSIRPMPAHHVLHAVLLDHLAADVAVGALDRLEHLTQRHAVGVELSRVEIHLVLAHEAADRSHLRDPGNRVELIADEEVLERPQLAEILAVGVQRVPEDLTDRRGVGAEDRNDTARHLRLDQIHALEDPLAREVEVGSVLVR